MLLFIIGDDMKKVRKIVAGLMIIIVALTFTKEDTINSYAVERIIDNFKEGNIYKSGDKVKLNDALQNDLEQYGGDEYYTYNYNMDFEDMDGYSYWYYGCDSALEDYDSPILGNGYEFTFPKVRKDVDVCSDGDIEYENAYWIVDNISSDEYNNYNITFRRIEYTAPTIKLECDATEVSSTTEAECKLTLNYVEDVTNLDFEINSDVFEIKDELALNNWKISETENNKYILTQKDINNGSSNTPVEPTRNDAKKRKNQTIKASLLGTNNSNANVMLLANTNSQEIFKFKVKTKANVSSVSLIGNLEVEEINYSDDKGAGAIEPQFAFLGLVKNETTNNNKKEENVKSEEQKTEAKKEEKQAETKSEVNKEEVNAGETKREEKNPVTADNVVSYIALLILSGLAIVGFSKYYKKAKNN